MRPEDASRFLEESGAILTGHFLLSSGRHSDRYVEKARVLERPAAVVALAREIASWNADVDVVVSPAVGAIVLGFAVALEVRARFVFAEREHGRLGLRRGFGVETGERALVVEDVITTGGSAREVWDMLGEMGADRIGVAALVDRSRSDVGFPVRSIFRVEAASWEPSECPLCGEGRPVTSPGSRHVVQAERSPSSRG